MFDGAKKLLKKNGYLFSEEIFKEKDLAVILIDMQEFFINQLRDGEADRIIPNQIKVIRLCAKNNVPIFALECKGCGKTIEALAQEIINIPNAVTIKKGYDNGFINTELEKELNQGGIKKLFFMGINADICVLETAKSARRKRYVVITGNDYVSGQHGDSKDNSISWYEKNGIVLYSEDD